MHYVYILESVAVPGHFYIGSTDNLRQRLRQHQADVDAHAAKYRPWKLKTYLAFEQKAIAVRFESYLKSGSGRAFVSVTSTSRIRHHVWIALTIHSQEPWTLFACEGAKSVLLY